MIGILESLPCNGEKTATCSRCGHRRTYRYNRKSLRVRDLYAAGWRIYIEFVRWRVKCPICTSYEHVHLYKPGEAAELKQKA